MIKLWYRASYMSYQAMVPFNELSNINVQSLSQRINCCCRDHHVMVVSPRYAEYEDTTDTGISVPVLLPPARGSQTHLSDSFAAADSIPSLSSSLADDAARQPASTEAAPSSESKQGQQEPDSNLEAPLQQRQDTAQYYLCSRTGVDHVFVDHPMYCRTSDIYGSSNVNTYQEAGDFPDLDLRYSILCQAALAAPLLLWQGSGPAAGR